MHITAILVALKTSLEGMLHKAMTGHGNVGEIKNSHRLLKYLPTSWLPTDSSPSLVGDMCAGHPGAEQELPLSLQVDQSVERGSWRGCCGGSAALPLSWTGSWKFAVGDAVGHQQLAGSGWQSLPALAILTYTWTPSGCKTE